ncbi:hypothetical protein N0V91_011170 [Didymella pomorum]|uniref:Xylanolytic transcriptional activator regulatory domain-containing protein n=1 Tax=Didymella pomorum TaxID=749634 RepID=A0A9W8YYG2_9PLEO|nr:hypothetical protein N0V91_011170 [Didymella pomorum]
MTRDATTRPQTGRQSGDRVARKARKRRCVQVACVPCRNRKSKIHEERPAGRDDLRKLFLNLFLVIVPAADGVPPIYHTKCFYKPGAESRNSKTNPSPPVTADVETPASAGFHLNSRHTSPGSYAHDFSTYTCNGPQDDVAALASSHRDTVLLASPALAALGPAPDPAQLLGQPACTTAGESKPLAHQASFGLASTQGHTSDGCERRETSRTAVVTDAALVEKLLDLYFRWSHTFYVLFSRDCFYSDFRSGRGKYCSPLLVNALCSYACLLANDIAGWTDPSHSCAAGDRFIAEAKRLLYTDESSCLTTIQALCVMSLRELSSGRHSSGFSYIGRCIRMCVELGLHLSADASVAPSLTPTEQEVRKVTFWGCFTVDA